MKSLSVTLLLMLASLQVHFIQAGGEPASTAPANVLTRSFSDPVGFCSEARGVLAGVLEASREPEIGTLTAGKRQLFLDDRGLSTTRNLKVNLHQPTKYGAVIRPDRPWEDQYLQVRTGPSWHPDEKLWMLWYTDGAYATSRDGIQWDKPVLGLRERQGSTRNNLMLPVTKYEFTDGSGKEIASVRGDGTIVLKVFYDARDPDPARRYKGIGYKGPICCLRSGPGPGFHPAISPDGRSWKLLDAFIPSQDESHLFQDEDNGIYAATVKHRGPYGRSVYLSVSRDFENWTDPRDCLIFHADRRDQELGAERVRMQLGSRDLRKPVYHNPEDYLTDIYNLPVFRYQGLYVGMPTVFNHSGNTEYNSDGFSMVELAVSRDLIHWDRVGKRKKFIPLSELDGGENYDVAQLLAGNQPIIKDGEIWFYYTGLKWRSHPSSRKGEKQGPILDAGAICLAKLRLDGFVSLDAGEETGYAVTKPFLLAGTELHANLKALSGELRVELLDHETRKPLPGYSLHESRPITGDSLDLQLRWKSGSDLSSLVGRIVQLRFVLKNASLYSYWVTKES